VCVVCVCVVCVCGVCVWGVCVCVCGVCVCVCGVCVCIIVVSVHGENNNKLRITFLLKLFCILIVLYYIYTLF